MNSLNISVEIAEQIAEYSDGRDLRELCQTCRTAMYMFQYKAYRRLVFREHIESAQTVLAVAEGPRAHLVRHLVFSPRDPQPVNADDQEPNPYHDPDVRLSDKSRQLLGSLFKFPNLEAFGFVLENWQDLTEWPGAPLSIGPLGFYEYHGSEDEEPWRILLNTSLHALTRSAGAFKRLEIGYLPPIPFGNYSAMQTVQWHELLLALKTLIIQLPSVYDGGAGSLTRDQVFFLCDFGYLFFDHGLNLEHPRVQANDTAVMSHCDTREPVPWSAARMPHLKRFEVTFASIDGNLTDFIANHADTLERVFLGHCFGIKRTDWATLFDKILAKKPSQLVEFRIVALTHPDGNNNFAHIWWDDATDEVDEMRSDEPEWKRWYPDTKRGFVEIAPERRHCAFAVGEACESYGALQGSWNRKWREDSGDESLNDKDEGEDSARTDDLPIWERKWMMLQALVQRNRASAGLGPGRPALVERPLARETLEKAIWRQHVFFG